MQNANERGRSTEIKENVNKRREQGNERSFVQQRLKDTRKDIESLKAELEKLVSTGIKEAENSQIPEQIKVPETIPAVAKSLQVDSLKVKSVSNGIQDTILNRQPSKSPVKVVKSNDKLKKLPEKFKKTCNGNQEVSPKKVKHYDSNEVQEYIKKQKERRQEQLKSQKNVKVVSTDLKKQKLQELHRKTLELVAKNVELKRERSKSRDRDAGLRLDKASSSRSVSRERVDKTKLTVENKTRSKSCEVLSIPNKSLFLQPPVPSLYLKKPAGKLLVNKEVIQPAIKVTNEEKETLRLPLENITTRTSNDLANTERSLAKNLLDLCTNREEPKNHLNTLSKIQEVENKPANSYPAWLQEKPLDNYPHNFINTVKRRLQFVVNSAKTTNDVGVQNSVLNSDATPSKNTPKTKKEILEVLQKSAKKGSISSQKYTSFEASLNKKTIHSEKSESESDTSKNIPDISSESGTSLKRNAESVRQNSNYLIDTKNLDNMQLKQGNLVSEASSAISTLKNSNNLEIPKRKLFNSSNLSFDEESLRASRESIISGNSPTYSKSSGSIIIEKSCNFNGDKTSSKSTNHEVVNSKENERFTSLLSELRASDPSKVLTLDKSSNSISTNNDSTKTDSSSNIKTASVSSKKTITSSIKEPSKFQSLMSGVHSSQTPQTITSQNATEKNNSVEVEVDSSKNTVDKVPLQEPALCLRCDKRDISSVFDKASILRNLTLKSDDKLDTTNEIHLKFEAEIHLLNDFNESLRQLSAAEKAFESLKSKNETHNRNTQTSIITTRTPSYSSSKSSEIHSSNNSLNKSQISTINYSRGSNVSEEVLSQSSAIVHSLDYTFERTIQDTSILDKIELSECSALDSTNKFAGISLRMFEQLIKDEDVRVENLKTILKIREQALLDRTKGELAYLEMQRQHLKETGKLHEASLVKKKQRGILLKHQQERHEMQRLKQMQKTASNERKTILKEQWNSIKTQLSNDNMSLKMKVHSKRERRKSGPMKVLHTESVRSETSVSQSSVGEEVLSVKSHSLSVVSRVSDGEGNMDAPASNKKDFLPLQIMKRTLLMREAALQKRRKAAEDLLKWHRKLVEEEKRISELEQLANKVISQEDASFKHTFSGKQLNDFWCNLSGSKETKFEENKLYPMSQVALKRFYQSAKNLKSRTESDLSDQNEHIPLSVNSETTQHEENSTKMSIESEQKSNLESLKASSKEYSSDYEIESVLEASEVGEIANNLSQLIDNFSKIENEITKKSIKSDEEEEEVTKDEATSNNVASLSTIDEDNIEILMSKLEQLEKSKTISEEESNKIPNFREEKTFEEEPTTSQSIELQLSLQSLATEQSIKELPEEIVKEEPKNDSESKSTVNILEEPEDESVKTISFSEETINSIKSENGTIDVKKRVSEIMADAGTNNREDKSPRMQDLYVTTYDVISSASSSDSDSTTQGSPKQGDKLFCSEAEELLKKQLAIEQEIKQLEQQQKNQIPYVFIREIPNKPPPPYKPPTSSSTPNIITVVPSKPEEIDEITKYSSKILHKAYMSKNLDNISVSENTLSLIAKNVGKECYKFVFDLCKEIAQEHYKQFEKDSGPTWLQTNKTQHLASIKPFDVNSLEKHMNKKLKELFCFKKTGIRENSIIKWCMKKRDHVDEILVQEFQMKEAEWTNFDQDERLVLDQITNNIMNQLISETTEVFGDIVAKKSYFY